MQTHHLLFPIIISTLFSVTGFCQSRYTNPDFKSIAKNEKTIAILPFQVSLKLRPKDTANITKKTLKEKETEEGYTAQNAIETFLLKKNQHRKYSVSFQDVGRTNGLLKSKGITPDSLATMEPEQICKVLGADGIITGKLVSTKPMSTGAAIAVDYFVGFGGKTNAGDCTIKIYDGAGRKLMWEYHRVLSQGLGSNVNTIIYSIMHKASRKFPYNR